MHKRKRFPRLRRLIPTTRRGRIVGGLLGFFVMVGVGAAVAAMFSALAPITGGGPGASSFIPVFNSLTSVSDNGLSCDTSAVNAGTGTLNIAVSAIYPSGSCDIATMIGFNGAPPEDGRVTGVTLPGLPTGWTASLVGASCGVTLPKNGPAEPVTIRLSAPEEANSAFTFAAGTSGVSVSPVSVAGTGAITCTPYTP